MNDISLTQTFRIIFQLADWSHRPNTAPWKGEAAGRDRVETLSVKGYPPVFNIHYLFVLFVCFGFTYVELHAMRFTLRKTIILVVMEIATILRFNLHHHKERDSFTPGFTSYIEMLLSFIWEEWVISNRILTLVQISITFFLFFLRILMIF